MNETSTQTPLGLSGPTRDEVGGVDEIRTAGIERGTGIPPRTSVIGLMRREGDAAVGRTTLIGFPVAAQPEVMRAAEKDEEYLTFICDSCYDVVRRFLGEARFGVKGLGSYFSL